MRGFWGSAPRGWRSGIVVVAIATTGFCAPAFGQIVPIDPKAEQLPDYGVQVGAFVMSPRVYVGALYSDNVRASNINRVEDEAGVLDATVNLASTWRRHALGASANVNALGYSDATSENELNYTGTLQGRYDFTQATTLSASGDGGRLTEGRDAANFVLNSVSPVTFFRYDTRLELAHEPGAMRYALSAGWRKLDFENVALTDGTIADQSTRDLNTYDAAFDVERLFSPGYGVFARLGYDKREYADPTARGRDSDGLEGRVGVRANITDLIIGEAYIGYSNRDYKSFPSIGSFSYGADLNWTPTREWQIEVIGQRSVGDTTLPGSPGYISSEIELIALRTVIDRLRMGPTIEYHNYDFQGVGRDDSLFRVGLDARIAITRFTEIDAGYRYTDRNSDVVGADFNQNRVTIGLTWRR